jgi:3-oxoacyl-[acyl-carrier protein] reductase
MMGEPARELEGQTAVVTGSSRGIGRAIALELARAGAAVLIHGRADRDHADAVAAEVRRQGVDALVVLLDLAPSASHASLVEQAWAWRAPTIWINNAGADVLTTPTSRLPFEEKLELLWRVDLQATVRLSRMAGARMKHSGAGTIINLGWDGTERGMAGDSGELYAAAKGAVTSFTRSLAQSLAPEVRVNCIAPGWIRTGWGEQASDYWQRRAAGESLLERWGTPDDVARLARFLASPAAAFINAQVIEVNGGRAARWENFGRGAQEP